MVYESDFYTVRRPRPTITSYSVTSPRIGWKPKPSVRNSVLWAELDRIYHRPRPHLGYMPLEDFLNSRPLIEFDDETKEIRAATDKLRRKIYTAIPHPRYSTPLQPIHPYYGSSYDRHTHPMVDDILYMSYYSEPSARTIGRGHLACVTFAGGRGYPRRRNHYYSDENRDISGEIKTRSYYHNSSNKAYVDAMSLPTGYASYLLRLKPPETDTLTNIDRAQVMSHAEERRKRIKKNKTDGDLISSENASKLSNGGQEPEEEQESLNKYTRQQSKPVEETNETQDIPVKETQEEDVSSKIEADVDDKIQYPKKSTVVAEEEVKPEKKSKHKKGSLSRTSSIQDTKAQSKEQAQEEKLNYSTSTPVEKVSKEIEKEDTEEVKQPTENLDSQEVKQEESIKDEEKELFSDVPSNLEVQETKQEETAEEGNKIEEPEEFEPPEEQSSQPIENSEQPLETEKGEKLDYFNEESKVEQGEENSEKVTDVSEDLLKEIESNEISNPNLETEQILPESQEINEKQNLEDAVTDENAPVECSDIDYKTQNFNEEDSKEALLDEAAEENKEEVEEEIAENDKKEEAVELNTENQKELDVETETKETEASLSKESEETESSEFKTSETTVLTKTIITSIKETSISGNIVEVSSSNETDFQINASEPQPLVEEPESPCDAEIISSKVNTNEICEVLSDVPEEQ